MYVLLSNGQQTTICCRQTWVSCHAYFIAYSELFLIFSQWVPRMSNCMEFGDYLEAGVHDVVKENTYAREWATAKVRVTKSLRQLGDNRSKWQEGFSGAMGFRVSEDSLVGCIIGYTLTEKVSLDMGSKNFKRLHKSQRCATSP